MSIAVKEQFQNPNHSLNNGQLFEEFSASEYGFSFIKSGFEHLQHDLVSDFKDYGIDVVGACPVTLSPAVVDYIYRESQQEPFYPAMHRHLVTTPVIAMALHSEGQDTQGTLNDLKCGINGRPSLREKYARNYEPIPDDEIDAWYRGVHPNQDEITVRLTQRNVFHAADTSDEAVESLQLLGTHNPEFLEAVRSDDPRITKLVRYVLRGQALFMLT